MITRLRRVILYEVLVLEPTITNSWYRKHSIKYMYLGPVI